MENKINSLLYFFCAVLILAKGQQPISFEHMWKQFFIDKGTFMWITLKHGDKTGGVRDYKSKVCDSVANRTTSQSNSKILYWALLLSKYLNITILQNDHSFSYQLHPRQEWRKRGEISHPAQRFFSLCFLVTPFGHLIVNWSFHKAAGTHVSSNFLQGLRMQTKEIFRRLRETVSRPKAQAGILLPTTQ